MAAGVATGYRVRLAVDNSLLTNPETPGDGPRTEVFAAYRCVESGRKVGNVVITIGEPT
jgi:hypothetical protein